MTKVRGHLVLRSACVCIAILADAERFAKNHHLPREFRGEGTCCGYNVFTAMRLARSAAMVDMRLADCLLKARIIVGTADMRSTITSVDQTIYNYAC